MALLGQASGGWTESSSALRILHVGVRNTVGILTDDAFTQTNPPLVAYTTTITNSSSGYDSTVLGVLSGSVAFTRPAAGGGGDNNIGGPDTTGAGTAGCVPLGVFINTAVGNDFENQPAVASGKGPYVSSQGTYANSLYETALLVGGTALSYVVGDSLYASQNGYLTNQGDNNNVYEQGVSLTTGGAGGIAAVVALQYTLMGILKMPADATQAEIVYDQRI